MNITITNGQEYWINFRDDGNNLIAGAFWNNNEQTYYIRTVFDSCTVFKKDTWEVWQYLTKRIKAYYRDKDVAFIDNTLNWAKRKKPVPRV